MINIVDQIQTRDYYKENYDSGNIPNDSNIELWDPRRVKNAGDADVLTELHTHIQ